MIDKRYLDRIKQGGVLIYLRKSRESEDTDDTLANHRFVLENLCKKNGLPYEIKEEIGSSDSIEYRQVFKEVIEKDIPSGLYSALVVYAQDRLSRSMGDLERIEETLANYDVLLVDKNETVTDYSKYEDRLNSHFKSFMAKEEYELIKKRLKDGKRANAMKGKWVNGKAPYGYFYDKNTRQLIPDTKGNPSPAEVVKSVFKDAYRGVSTSDIAYKLNKKGIYTTRGNYWSNTAIQRMLRQEVYLGRTIYGKSSGSGHLNKKTTPLKVKDRSDWIVVNNAHEPLISEDIFEDVQQQLSRRYKVIATRKSKTSTLSGLVKCGQKNCGAGLYIQRFDHKDNVIKSCWKKDPFGNKCINKGMAESKIVDETIKQVKIYRDEIAVAMGKGTGSDTARDKILKELADLEKQLKSLEAKFDKLDDFLEDGIYTREKYMYRKEKLTNKQKDLNTELPQLQNELKKLDNVEDKDKIKILDMVLAAFDGLKNEEHRNKILKSIISSIDMKRDSRDEDGEISVTFL